MLARYNLARRKRHGSSARVRRMRGRSELWTGMGAHGSDFDQNSCFRRSEADWGVPSVSGRGSGSGSPRVGFAMFSARQQDFLSKSEP